jgi:D-alanine-D-alanine ligase
MSAEDYWPEKRTVVLLFGGRSSEHGISCVTAAGVLNSIDRDRFDVIPVGITKRGATVLLDEGDLADFKLVPGGLPEVQENGTRVLWPASVDTRTISVIGQNGEVRSLGHIDAVLPMMHGAYGEDGTVQGLFELVDLPYVGSGVLGSALCMDKHAVKTVLADAGIAVAPWNTLTRSQLQRDPSLAGRVDEGLSYPLFVKPNRAGSSVGVSKVSTPDELPAALDVAFAEDSVVLVESGVVGREVEIAVLEGRGDDAPRTSEVIGEIVFNGREFYDFEAKYLGAAGIELSLPADVTDAEFRSIRDAAVLAFEVTQCAGLARIDFFLTADGPVLNEINTLPGFTPISMYPRLWNESGLGYRELITELIELALERG